MYGLHHEPDYVAYYKAIKDSKYTKAEFLNILCGSRLDFMIYSDRKINQESLDFYNIKINGYRVSCDFIRLLVNYLDAENGKFYTYKLEVVFDLLASYNYTPPPLNWPE